MSQALLSSLPANAFVHGFFVFEWNSYVYFAAMDAQLEWVDAVTNRT